MTIIFSAGIIIAISVIWLQSRPKMRMIDVLKTYMPRRGEESPGEALSWRR